MMDILDAKKDPAAAVSVPKTEIDQLTQTRTEPERMETLIADQTFNQSLERERLLGLHGKCPIDPTSPPSSKGPVPDVPWHLRRMAYHKQRESMVDPDGAIPMPNYGGGKRGRIAGQFSSNKGLKIRRTN